MILYHPRILVKVLVAMNKYNFRIYVIHNVIIYFVVTKVFSSLSAFLVGRTKLTLVTGSAQSRLLSTIGWRQYRDSIHYTGIHPVERTICCIRIHQIQKYILVFFLIRLNSVSRDNLKDVRLADFHLCRRKETVRVLITIFAIQ